MKSPDTVLNLKRCLFSVLSAQEGICSLLFSVGRSHCLIWAKLQRCQRVKFVIIIVVHADIVLMYLMRLCQWCQWKFSVILRLRPSRCICCWIVEEKRGVISRAHSALPARLLGFHRPLLFTHKPSGRPSRQGWVFSAAPNLLLLNFQSGVHSSLVCSNFQV